MKILLSEIKDRYCLSKLIRAGAGIVLFILAAVLVRPVFIEAYFILVIASMMMVFKLDIYKDDNPVGHSYLIVDGRLVRTEK